MINNQKLRPYLFAFLIFCVFSSKNIIIYNEETLVALSFLAFVYFIFHYFGDTIKESLNERSYAIKTELQNFLILKQESLNELYREHKKISNLSTGLKSIGNFTNSEISTTSFLGEKALDFIFYNQMLQKLKTLSFSKLNLQQKLQQSMAQNILSIVLVKFQRLKKDFLINKKGKSLNQKIIKLAITILTSKKNELK